MPFTTRMFVFIAAPILGISITSEAAPVLSLSLHGTSQHSTSVPADAGAFTLDIGLDTGGAAVSGLQYHLAVTKAGQATNALNFASILSPLGDGFNRPFQTADINIAPSTGDAVNASAVTVFFKSSGADYAAYSGAIASQAFSLAALTPGICTITPIGDEFTNATDDLTTFGDPTPFTLTVTTIPEPHALAVAAVGTLALRRRRMI